jgi:hypothetical protein
LYNFAALSRPIYETASSLGAPYDQTLANRPTPNNLKAIGFEVPVAGISGSARPLKIILSVCEDHCWTKVAVFK